MRRKAYVGIAILAAILVCAAAGIHIVRAQAFMTQIGAMAESLAAQTLGTDVHIGAVRILSLHEVSIDDIVMMSLFTISRRRLSCAPMRRG